MGLEILTLGSSKTYTRESLLGGGAVVGKNVTISSITPIEGGNRVTFSYTLDDGTVKTSTMDVMDGKDGIDGTNGKNGKDGQPGKDGSDGVGISKIEKIGTVDLVDTYRITFTDNSTFDYEVKNGKDGQGGGTADVPIEKIKVNGELQTPVNKVVDITVPTVTNDLTDELKSSYDDAVTAKHTHDNKTVLDGITAEKVEAWDKAEENVQSDWNETDDSADGFIKNKPAIPDITGLATETYVDNKVADYTKTVDLADVATSGSYNDLADKPTIPDAYDDTALSNRVKSIEDEVPNLATKTYVGEQIANAEHLKREIVTVLPSDEEASDNIIYMLKVESATGNDKYKEYMKIDGTVQMVGDTSVDLTDYAKTVDIPTTVAELTDSADYAKKTDLHSHDNKTVLDGITEEKVTAWDNKSDFSGSYNDLNDKPTIDAELSNTSENAIQNKVVTKEINKLYSDISFNDFDTATDGISFTDAEDGNMLVTDCTKNLLNPTLETTEQNGVTCTRNVDANGNPDGTYTLNGTATKGVTLYIAGSPTKNTVGGYKLLGCPINGSNDTYRIVVSYYENGEWRAEGSDIGNGVIIDGTYSRLNYLIKVESGTTVTNLVFKPMLTTDLSATYDDFVPYSGYDIKTCGKNLVNVNSFPSSSVREGVTFTTDKKAGTITLNGTATGVYNTMLFTFSAIDGIKEYSFGGWDTRKITPIHDRVGLYSADEFNFAGLNNKTNIEYNKNTTINMVYKTGDTFDNFVIKPYVSANYDTYDGYDNIEPYKDGGTVHIDSTTEFPLLGLKSFNGITNIISPANVKCVYPTNESGKGVLDSLYNKDKMLTEQNENLEVLGKCKNLLNPTLQTTTQNGVTCTRNVDGTYTLNGTATENVTFHLNVIKMENGTTIKVLGTISGQNAWIGADKFTGGTWKGAINSVGGTNSIGVFDCERLDVYIRLVKGRTANNEILKPMITTNLSATYDDFVPYTGDGETLTHDVAELKNDLNGSLDNVRLTKLIPNAVTDINSGVSTGIDCNYFAITSVVGSGNYFYIPYQFEGYWFVSIRTFPDFDIVASTNVGNVIIYYMKR